MDYKNSRVVDEDTLRIPFSCNQGYEQYLLVFVDDSPFEVERHLDRAVCVRGPITEKEHKNCKQTPNGQCWKDILTRDSTIIL